MAAAVQLTADSAVLTRRLVRDLHDRLPTQAYRALSAIVDVVLERVCAPALASRTTRRALDVLRHEQQTMLWAKLSLWQLVSNGSPQDTLDTIATEFSGAVGGILDDAEGSGPGLAQALAEALTTTEALHRRLARALRRGRLPESIARETLERLIETSTWSDSLLTSCVAGVDGDVEVRSPTVLKNLAGEARAATLRHAVVVREWLRTWEYRPSEATLSLVEDSPAVEPDTTAAEMIAALLPAWFDAIDRASNNR